MRFVIMCEGAYILLVTLHTNDRHERYRTCSPEKQKTLPYAFVRIVGTQKIILLSLTYSILSNGVVELYRWLAFFLSQYWSFSNKRTFKPVARNGNVMARSKGRIRVNIHGFNARFMRRGGRNMRELPRLLRFQKITQSQLLV